MSKSENKAIAVATGGLLAFALVLTPALVAIGTTDTVPAKEIARVSEPFEAKAGSKQVANPIAEVDKKQPTTIEQATKIAVKEGIEVKEKHRKTKGASPLVQPERASWAKLLEHGISR